MLKYRSCEWQQAKQRRATVVGHIRDTCVIEMLNDWPTPPPHMHRIAKETGTDKYVHQFTMFYPHLSIHFASAPLNMLEIAPSW